MDQQIQSFLSGREAPPEQKQVRESLEVKESTVKESEVTRMMEAYAKAPATEEQEPADVYVKAGCRFSNHILAYIKMKDAGKLFNVRPVEDLNPETIPDWLRGVPTITAPCEKDDSMQVFVGEAALEFVREHVEGPVFRDAMEGGDELEVVDGSSGGYSSISCVTSDFRRPPPEDEEELMHYLLPLPYDPKLRAQEGQKVSKESVEQMMAMREQMLQEK